MLDSCPIDDYTISFSFKMKIFVFIRLNEKMIDKTMSFQTIQEQSFLNFNVITIYMNNFSFFVVRYIEKDV